MENNKKKKSPNFIEGETSPTLEPMTKGIDTFYKKYTQLPNQGFKPIETKPISRFKAFIIYWFGTKHCNFNGYDMYLFRSKAYSLPSKTKT